MADYSEHTATQRPAVLEDRQATRFRKEPDTDFAVVWQKPGDELLCEVHDESLLGLGLILKDVGAFHVGTAATLVYHHDVLVGTVRHITPLANGTFLVGFECASWHESLAHGELP